MFEDIVYKPVVNGKVVKRILTIRLQAIGDVMIAMPYLYDLKMKLPKSVTLDLLVREEAEHIPKSFIIFDHIYVLKGGRNTRLQFISFLFMYPRLFFKGYDVILDLQNLKISRIICKLLLVRSWTRFDRFSSNFAGKRYANTINALNLANVEFRKLDNLKKINENDLLTKFGLEKDVSYIIINPAGAFENRNWSIPNYVEFCKLWLQKIDPATKFLVLGIEKIKEKAKQLKDGLGDNLINLCCMTTQEEALHLLLHSKLMVTEDSGLMHMNYCLGKPTVAILGSTRNDWVDPLLPHTYFFNSSDLECGNCMLTECRFDEIKCLTRVKPQMVVDSAAKLLKDLNIKHQLSQ